MADSKKVLNQLSPGGGVFSRVWPIRGYDPRCVSALIWHPGPRDMENCNAGTAPSGL